MKKREGIDMSGGTIGVYAGTFDPVTNGHLDIISRAIRIVDQLIIGVAVNAGKGPLFNLDERRAMVETEIAEFGDKGAGIEVRAFEGLLVDFAAACDAVVVVRGLRAVTDFDYEFQMTGMNARLNPNVETVFLMASESNQFISSRLVKEICALGGDIGQFVSPRVQAKMAEKYKS
jgi:pantetheine-phosphate adenylyltransferase|tara:strand:+ start:3416 stop:3940 length:525 start_codon:yes stop_codon:yes gene_type:complete